MYRFALKQKTLTRKIENKESGELCVKQPFVHFLIPAGAGKRHPRLKVVMCCVCNSMFSFTLDQLGFPVHAYFCDVYASILLFHEKLAECLGKPGMVSNSCL